LIIPEGPSIFIAINYPADEEGMPMNHQIQYLTDARGKKQAVLLPVEEYDRLMAEMEDLRDALQLDERARTATRFVPYDEVRRRLKKQGKL
jgi:PHD/YefM family antitoxin component YafN of YafNO toxin-antitoxin module